MSGFLHGVEVIEIDTGSRPIETVRSAVIGIVGTAPRADEEAFPLNVPVLVAGSRSEAAKLLKHDGDDDGTLPDALDSIFDQAGAVVVVVRVEKSDDANQQMANVIGGTDANTGQYTGVHALTGAESKLGVVPRILIAPGYTHQRPGGTKNAVVAELQGIAARMRAIVIADGPNTNDEEAKQAANDAGSPRVYMIDPWVQKLNSRGLIVSVPASPCVAGVIARTDNEVGFWASPSNRQINGIVGVSRPVDFVLGDSASRANLLNEGRVATIIRQDGYRLWGNRSCTTDTKWHFLSVRRTADIINDSLQRAHLWALDRNISKTYLAEVTESVSAYLRHLANIGAIINGKCWADPELNTPSTLALGHVYVDFDFTAAPPAERITFRSMLTDRYLTEVL